MNYERFIFVLDLYNFRLSHVHGVRKWLGYADNKFTIENYMEIIHPSHRIAQKITSYEFFGSLMRGEFPISFMDQQIATNFAIRHHDGHYLYVKRLAAVFQYDEKTG